MSELFADYLPFLVVALAMGVIVAFLLLRPRQRVRLSDPGLVRPHMNSPAKDAAEGNSLADEVAAATSDVTGEIIGAQVHRNLPGASGPPDQLDRLKGVGPKLAQVLNERGIIRFDQLARLSPEEVERLDMSLGAFRGRLQRDRIIEQADYLARGDEDGFQHRFGKL